MLLLSLFALPYMIFSILTSQGGSWASLAPFLTTLIAATHRNKLASLSLISNLKGSRIYLIGLAQVSYLLLVQLSMVLEWNHT